MERKEKWRQYILMTRDERELVRVMAGFCAGWTPDELAILPEDCPRCIVTSIESIEDLAWRYTMAELACDDARAGDVLAELAGTFVLGVQQLKRFRDVRSGR